MMVIKNGLQLQQDLDAICNSDFKRFQMNIQIIMSV